MFWMYSFLLTIVTLRPGKFGKFCNVRGYIEMGHVM
jgi:hypothetical protein